MGDKFQMAAGPGNCEKARRLAKESHGGHAFVYLRVWWLEDTASNHRKSQLSRFSFGPRRHKTMSKMK
jgi:hypothetical protein